MGNISDTTPKATGGDDVSDLVIKNDILAPYEVDVIACERWPIINSFYPPRLRLLVCRILYIPIIYECSMLNGARFRMLGSYTRALVLFYFARCRFSLERSYRMGN